MQSLKEDKQFQHSTFLEYTIVLLIGFEVVVEMHALGWITWPPWMLALAGASQADLAKDSVADENGHAVHGRGSKALIKRGSSGAVS